MNTKDFDQLSENIKKKNIEVQNNYRYVTEISGLITKNFAVCDLTVASTSDKAISISGIVDDENEKQNVETFLINLGKVKQLINELTIFENKVEIFVTINRQEYSVFTLKDLENVFDKYRHEEFSEYFINGHGETGIILLMNKISSLAIYIRFDGDSGFTTSNPNGQNENTQEFILSNGQQDVYTEDMLVNNRNGFEILRYYLLTGEMYPAIEWKEEN